MSVVSDCGRVDSYSIISDMNMQILFLEKIISLLRFSGLRVFVVRGAGL